MAQTEYFCDNYICHEKIYDMISNDFLKFLRVNLPPPEVPLDGFYLLVEITKKRIYYLTCFFFSECCSVVVKTLG